MEKYVDKAVEIKFEIDHKEIDKMIEDFKEKGIQINPRDIARIHAHVSPNGENCKECHKKVINAGIITDFNEDIDDGK